MDTVIENAVNFCSYDINVFSWVHW